MIFADPCPSAVCNTFDPIRSTNTDRAASTRRPRRSNSSIHTTASRESTGSTPATNNSSIANPACANASAAARSATPEPAAEQSRQLIASQPPAQGRQRSTPIARTGPIRLETCDRSHGTSLINTCDNQADDVGTAKFF
jgi:hypothetical protein